MQPQSPAAPAFITSPVVSQAMANPQLAQHINNFTGYIDLYGQKQPNNGRHYNKLAYTINPKRALVLADVKKFAQQLTQHGFIPTAKQLQTLRNNIEYLVPNALGDHMANLIGYQTQINLFIKRNYNGI